MWLYVMSSHCEVLAYSSQMSHHVDEKSPHEEFMMHFADRV